jgi:hypothetical protein
VRQWGSRATIDPVLVLDAKGEKIRPKQEMDQLPLENFENSRVELLICQNSKCLFLSKVGLLWGECLIMGNRGSFRICDQFLLEQLSLCLNKCV